MSALRTTNSPNASWGSTQINYENFRYTWRINNFKIVNEMLTELQSPTFSTGVDQEIQWRIMMRKSAVHEAYSSGKWCFSFHLILVTGSKGKVPAKFTFSILDPQNVRTHAKSGTVTFTKEGTDSTHGFKDFIRQETLANCVNSRTGEVTILLDISYLNEPAHESGQDIQFETPKDRLSADFGCLLDNHNLSDMEFSVSGQIFKAHKIILSARSSVFDAMFKNYMIESKNNKVVINDIDKDVFSELLKYIYTDKCDKLEQMAAELFVVADKYELDGLKLMCVSELYKGLTVENVSEILALAELHGLAEIKAKAIKFINNHTSEIVDTEGFMKLMASQPKLVADVFRARK